MIEDKIKHTEALSLCSELNKLQYDISAMYHELVLHYCATGVPSHKTQGKIRTLERRIESVQEELETIKVELDDLDR